MGYRVHILLLFFIWFPAGGSETTRLPAVTYDGRSLIINGTRQLLFSGSIHYTRSTPQMWPDLIKKAKEGGLNLIQTYVFWNVHEPLQGQYNFEGNYDLVKFIKLIGEQKMWVTLRVGPYIESEWNMGGFPYWLREVPAIKFRTYNEPFMFHMQKYVKMIIGLMKMNNLFAEQGGPIILAQIENEYNNVAYAYKEEGAIYIQWAAEMAVRSYDMVPWIMCKQKDAPISVISTCNGRQCGDTFPGPNGPNKPFLWTENWTTRYKVFGDMPSERSVEDIAFAVARFFARNGTLNNYYMYHGGTNFGRTSSSFVTTRYYDEAPLDEYGLKREPKFGHLRDLHRALRLCKKPLLHGTPKVLKLSQDLEITTFEKPGTDICAAFLTNNSTKIASVISFRGHEYYLPRRSISILPNCKTLVYNTAMVVAQHSVRKFVVSKESKIGKWRTFRESIPITTDLEIQSDSPLELYSLTKDTSDYAWYSTSVDISAIDLSKQSPKLEVGSLGHALLAFVNGKFIGFGHGNNVEKSHVLSKPVNLKLGINHISLLAMTVGFPDSGAFLERRIAGPRDVSLQDMNGTLDITSNNWTHQVGITGEKLQIYTRRGSRKVNWGAMDSQGAPMTWYKATFDSPEGDDPVAIRMKGMQKGMLWINGLSIGRYWSSYLSPIGNPTQEEYHIPRAFLKAKNNLLVVLEEVGGSPENIRIKTVNRNTLCSIVSEDYPPDIKTWMRKNNSIQAVVTPVKAASHLTCPGNKIISKVEFVGFGVNKGLCGSFRMGHCDSPKAFRVVGEECLGKNQCTVQMDRRKLIAAEDEDFCPDIARTLAIQVVCA